MSQKLVGRRKFLLGTALGGVLTAAIWTSSTRAFTEEDLPLDSAIGLAYANRCSGVADSGHAAIKAELDAELATKSAPRGTLLSEQQTCPLCNCPIIATRQF